MKKIGQLFNEDLVVVSSGYIIERGETSTNKYETPYKHLKELSGKELRSGIVEMLVDDGSGESDDLPFYNKNTNEVLQYQSEKGDLCVGAFKKLQSKFQDSKFNSEKDKALIEKVVVLKDLNDREVRLGDIVSVKDSCLVGRVVWQNNKFCLYDDTEEATHLILPNFDMLKIN